MTGVPTVSGARHRPHASGRAGLSHHQVLASTSRMAVLDFLRSRAEPLGVGEVAEHVGLHLNTVRSHLDLLVESGYAIRHSEAPSGPGRPRVVYQATTAPDGEGSYRLLAEMLVQYLAANSDHPGDAAAEAGRSWAVSATQVQSGGVQNSRVQGRREVTQETVVTPVGQDAAITDLVRMLGDIGFAPEVSADGTSIYLHRCPFREMARSQPDVVCGAHLGMIRGALAELDAPVAATRLLPFVEPGLCVTTLTPLHGRPVAAVSPDPPGQR